MSDAASSQVLAIDGARLAEWMQSDPALQVIDVREPYEREAGHIEATRHVELTQLTAQAPSIDRAHPVVFYCRVGARSRMAAEAFRASGYEAYSLDGGLVRWAEQGRALSPEGGTVADH
ncbi:MAG: rhodanese-like protein [Solirubrobacterales bacterium]|jgi:rhodanese-related sulfurtransferase|nr:rhodanese-like protein [Solirubrobacterales bacterium]